MATGADDDPLVRFRRWLDEAEGLGLPEPRAMTLATATLEGAPSARIVLLKEADETGFLFATNYESRKAVELAENPRAALVLYWEPLHRQIRVEGRVERAPAELSDCIYDLRPRGARIGAWASPQSREIPGREFLERRVSAREREFGESIPRPEFWGAYRLIPESIEFWQGRENRLHERELYRRAGEGRWAVAMLAP